jgi:signal transduction histidine kinase
MFTGAADSFSRPSALTELLTIVAAEARRVLGVPTVTIEKYESTAELVVLTAAGADRIEAGSRRPLETGSVAATVLQTGRSFSLARVAAVPIIVEEQVWGLMSVRAARDSALPDTTETRLAKLAALVASDVSDARALEGLRRFEDEQTVLRRVAMLVAGGASTERVFEVVCAEVGRLLGVPAVVMERYDPDGCSTLLATWGDPGAWAQAGFAVGSRSALDGSSVAGMVLDTGRAATITDAPEVSGTSWVGAPITVDGRTWGVISVRSAGASTPAGIEDRLTRLADLVEIEVANVEARNKLRGLVEEQAALRRVATLVAEGKSADQVFDAVCEEAGRLIGAPGVFLDRYDPDGYITVLASWGATDVWTRAGLVVGSRWPLDGPSVARSVLETGRPAMIDDFSGLPGTIAKLIRAAPAASMAGVPITVDGETWGVVIACTDGLSAAALPVSVESRLAHFTDLVAIAVSNLESRNDLDALVEEQAALRRIATLVARGANEQIVFAAVCAETGLLMGASSVNLARFTPDGFYVAVAGWSLRETHVEPGTRLPLEPGSVSEIVWRTARPARLDSYENATSQLGLLVRSLGIRCTVGVPIIVEGRLWGVLIPGRDWDEPFAAGTEERVARFADLTAMSLANATARSELIASRARIVAAGDEARRKIERNLHDGIQQRLIALSLDLESVRETVGADDVDVLTGLERVTHELEAVHEDLRQLSHGLHPSLLSRRGLAPALAALARTSPIPVTMRLDVTERLLQPVEIGIYYVVAEAITNAAKHSRATEVSVTVTRSGETVRAAIEDDGVGGADASIGTGLTGLVDRVEALGGTLNIESRPDAGTRISVAVPIREAAP